MAGTRILTLCALDGIDLGDMTLGQGCDTSLDQDQQLYEMAGSDEEVRSYVLDTMWTNRSPSLPFQTVNCFVSRSI